MVSCILKHCKNRSSSKKEDSGVTFHRFPGPDRETRETWIEFVQKNRNEETWRPSLNDYICSIHFKDEDKYLTKTGRLFLKKCAVPYDGSDSEPGTPKFAEPICELVSDTESICDTPQVIMLKEKLRKEISARRVLAEKYKLIKQRYRYLKRRNKSYKLMVEAMKTKFGSDETTENVLGL